MSERSRMLMCAPLSVVFFCYGCMPKSQSENEDMNPSQPKMTQPSFGGVSEGQSSSETPPTRPLGGQVNRISDLEDTQPSEPRHHRVVCRARMATAN